MPSSFDRDLWRQRTVRRFNRSVAAERPGAGRQLHVDMDAVDQLELVVSWCESKGLEVVFARMKSGGLYEGDGEKISVSSHLRPERQLHVLLHECGHYLISRNRPEERFVHGYLDSTDRSDQHRVDVVDEELEAWSRGLKLARRLKVKVDVERYNQTRTEYVKTYLQWAVRVSDRPAKKAWRF